MKLFLRVFIVIVLALPMTAFAQSDTDTDSDEFTIADLATLYDNLFNYDSMTMKGVTVFEQNFSQGGSISSQTAIQNLFGVAQFADGEMIALSAELNQSMDFGSAAGGQINFLMEMIFIEENLYMRVNTTDRSLQAVYPEGWVNLSDNTADLGTLSMLNFEGYTQTFRQPLSYPLNEQTVISVEEVALDPELHLPAGTLTYHAVFDVLAAMEDNAMMSMFGDLDQLGIDMADLMQQMLQGAELNVFTYVLDGTIIRIQSTLNMDSSITMMGQTFDFTQLAQSVINYSNFNQPVEIVAPPIGESF